MSSNLVAVCTIGQRVHGLQVIARQLVCRDHNAELLFDIHHQLNHRHRINADVSEWHFGLKHDILCQEPCFEVDGKLFSDLFVADGHEANVADTANIKARTTTEG